MLFRAVLSLLLLPHVTSLVVQEAQKLGKLVSELESEGQPLIIKFPIKSGAFRCTNGNTGSGYIMYSHTDVNKRWNIDKNQADFRQHTASNLVCVRYRKGNWQYDTNWADEPDRASKVSWHYFKPEATDVLISKVDFNTMKTTSLKGTKFKHNGMNGGFKAGKVMIGKVAGGFVTSGGNIYPYPDTVAFKPVVPPPKLAALPANNYRAATGSFRCTDSNTGRGFLMYTMQPVNDRWKLDKFQNDFRQHTASNFVCVRYKGGKWQYDSHWQDEKDRASKKSWHDFVPKRTDMVVATVDYLTGKLKDLRRVNFMHNGMQMGYSGGDVKFFGNLDTNGKLAVGDFRVNGTYVISWSLPKPLAISSHTVSLHKDARTFTCSKHPGELGFIMFANVTILSRFKLNLTADPTALPQKRNKFACVRYNDSKWQYDASWQKKPAWVAFVPAPSDIVVASVDYSNGAIKRMEGTNVRYAGMQMGFAGGDLWVLARQSYNQRNHFKLIGDQLRIYGKDHAAIPPFKPPTTVTTTTTTAKAGTTVVVPFFTTTSKAAR